MCISAADQRKVTDECRLLTGKISEKVGECEDLSGKLSMKVGECEELKERIAECQLVNKDLQKVILKNL